MKHLKHDPRTVALLRVLALLTVLCALAASAGAESLFSLLATATPAPDATPTPEAPDAAPTSEAPAVIPPFAGLSYGDWAGKEPGRRILNETEGTTKYIYEQVSGEAFGGYTVFLGKQGCEMKPLATDNDSAVSWVVSNSAAESVFLLIYEADAQRLTLERLPDTPETADPSPAAEPDTETPGADDPETGDPADPSARTAIPVCPHCNRGLCRDCKGAGFFKCKTCGGLGRCTKCDGKREFRSPGYGGVGTATYTTCDRCGGTGRCDDCDGRGRVECGSCDHGVCRYCQGNYVLDP